MTWVEEMHAKHARLATNVLVLVSRSGFTAEVHRVADLSGIRCLELTDVDPAAAGRLFPDVQSLCGKVWTMSIERVERVLFLCFNKPLADLLAHDAEGFTVKTFHSLARELIAEAALAFDPPRDPVESDRFWKEVLPERMLEALDALPDQRWDAVIVDEGQDFRELWWTAVEELLADQNSVLWVFFDPHQNIFGGGPTDAMGLQAAALTWNCRNTERIAEYSGHLVGVEPKLKPEAPKGIDVEESTCADENQMVKAVQKALHRLIVEEKLGNDRVMVLSAHVPRLSPVYQAGKLGNFTLVQYPSAPGPNEVAFSSLQRFKGLEADAVILCDVEEGRSNCTAPNPPGPAATAPATGPG